MQLEDVGPLQKSSDAATIRRRCNSKMLAHLSAVPTRFQYNTNGISRFVAHCKIAPTQFQYNSNSHAIPRFWPTPAQFRHNSATIPIQFHSKILAHASAVPTQFQYNSSAISRCWPTPKIAQTQFQYNSDFCPTPNQLRRSFVGTAVDGEDLGDVVTHRFLAMFMHCSCLKRPVFFRLS